MSHIQSMVFMTVLSAMVLPVVGGIIICHDCCLDDDCFDEPFCACQCHPLAAVVLSSGHDVPADCGEGVEPAPAPCARPKHRSDIDHPPRLTA